MKALFGALILAAGTVPAAAQGVPCAERAALTDRLGTVYGETRRIALIDERGNLKEIWASR